MFTKYEIEDYAISIVVLTISFDFAFSHIIIYPGNFIYFLIPSFLAVITGFFLHELGHKIVSMRLGYPAFYRRWNLGLLLGLIFSFFGFVFAAPGAVNIYGYVDRDSYGKISIAGPATNLILSVILIPFSGFPIVGFIFFVNAFLAFFNLLPIPPLDGSKVLRWNISIYIITLIISIALLIYAYKI